MKKIIGWMIVCVLMVAIPMAYATVVKDSMHFKGNVTSSATTTIEGTGLVITAPSTISETITSSGSNTWSGSNNFTAGISVIGAAETAENGAGAVGTGGSLTTYRYSLPNGDIVTEIQVDITGLGCKGDAADDVIGVVTAAPDAYIGRYVVATYGVVYRVEMICVELPTEGTATITTDIDIASGTASTGGYDDAVGDITVLNTAALVLGEMASNDLPNMSANDYIYLVEGDTTAATGVYSGGQYIIRFYGHAAL
jgi:hypothetical protein